MTCYASRVHSPTVISVSTSNLCHGRHGGSPIVRGWRLAAAARLLDADIAGYCEVDRFAPSPRLWSEVHMLAGATPEAAVVFGAAQQLNFGRESGSALIVRGTIDPPRVIELPDPDGAARRIALIATVIVAGHRLCVCATHLRPLFAVSTAQLRALRDELADVALPTIVMGDFNLGRRALRDVLEPAGFTVANGPPTFPRHTPTVRIDHLAVRGMEIRSSSTVDVGVGDHLAVTATVVVP